MYTTKKERMELDQKEKVSRILANEMVRNGGQFVPIEVLRKLVEVHDVQKKNKEV